MKTSRGTFNLVIIFLGLTLLICVGGGLWLANYEKELPEFIVGIGGGALGAMGGLLSRNPNDETPQAVTVVDTDVPLGDIEDL